MTHTTNDQLSEIEKKLSNGVQLFSSKEVALLINTIRIMKAINRRKGIN